MNTMRATYQKTSTTWLRTDHPVIPINPSTWEHRREVEDALRRGVMATPDSRRDGFYEIEVGDNWYYIHIASRIAGVYLVAAQKSPISARPAAIAHHCA